MLVKLVLTFKLHYTYIIIKTNYHLFKLVICFTILMNPITCMYV